MSDSPALDQSITSPESEPEEAVKWNLANVLEEEEEQGNMTVVHVPKRAASLAEELGLLEDEDDYSRGGEGGSMFKRGTRVYRTPSPGRRRYSAKEKGKGKMVVSALSIGHGGGMAVGGGVVKTREKENAMPGSKKSINVVRHHGTASGVSKGARGSGVIPARGMGGRGGASRSNGPPSVRSSRDAPDVVKVRHPTERRA
jgi:hypothetical protein